jgi:hypothetical protein
MDIILSFLLSTNIVFCFKTIRTVEAFNYRLRLLEKRQDETEKVVSRLEQEVYPNSNFDTPEYLI